MVLQKKHFLGVKDVFIKGGNSNIEALAAGIRKAKYSNVAAEADQEMLDGKSIIGSMVIKLSKETPSRWFLYLGEVSGKEEQKVFSG